MKNTILKFDSRTVKLGGEEFEVPDYFSQNTNVQSFFENMENKRLFYVTRNMPANDKLERLQHALYKNPDYWDVIMTVNSMDQFFSVPLSDEYQFKEIDEFTDRYFNEVYFRDHDNNESYLRPEFEKSFNEQLRKLETVKLITPQKMGEFIQLLKRHKLQR